MAESNRPSGVPQEPGYPDSKKFVFKEIEDVFEGIAAPTIAEAICNVVEHCDTPEYTLDSNGGVVTADYKSERKIFLPDRTIDVQGNVNKYRHAMGHNVFVFEQFRRNMSSALGSEASEQAGPGNVIHIILQLSPSSIHFQRMNYFINPDSLENIDPEVDVTDLLKKAFPGSTSEVFFNYMEGARILSRKVEFSLEERKGWCTLLFRNTLMKPDNTVFGHEVNLSLNDTQGLNVRVNQGDGKEIAMQPWSYYSMRLAPILEYMLAPLTVA